MNITVTNEEANAIVEYYIKIHWGLSDPKIVVYFDSDTKPYYHVYSYVRFNDKIYKKLTMVSLDNFKTLLLYALTEQEKPVDRVGLLQEKHNKISYQFHLDKKKIKKEKKKRRAQQTEERIRSEEKPYRAQLTQTNYAPVFIVNNQNRKLRKERIGE